MTDVDYNRDLRGFLEREGGISLSEWLAFADNEGLLEKVPPTKGVNPFTQRPCDYHNNNYYVVVCGKRVGLVCWEDSECLGVAGHGRDVDDFIAKLSSCINARFQPIEA